VHGCAIGVAALVGSSIGLLGASDVAVARQDLAEVVGPRRTPAFVCAPVCVLSSDQIAAAFEQHTEAGGTLATAALVGTSKRILGRRHLAAIAQQNTKIVRRLNTSLQLTVVLRPKVARGAIVVGVPRRRLLSAILPVLFSTPIGLLGRANLATSVQQERESECTHRAALPIRPTKRRLSSRLIAQP
jgi:hypothetical protein